MGNLAMTEQRVGFQTSTGYRPGRFMDGTCSHCNWASTTTGIAVYTMCYDCSKVFMVEVVKV